MKKRIIRVITILTVAVLLLTTIILTYSTAGEMEARNKAVLERTVTDLAKWSKTVETAQTLIENHDSSESRLHVLTSDGEVLNGSSFDRTVLENELFQNLLLKGEGSIRLNPQGEPLIVAIGSLSEGGYLVSMTALKPFSALDLPWQSILWALLILLLLAVAAGYFLTGYILEPVGELTVATGKITSGEMSSRIKVDHDPELRSLAGNFNTLSDRLESTALISSESQNQLEAILGSIDSGVIAIDRKYRIILFNPFARRIFGIYSDVIGKDIREVIVNANLDKMLTVSDEFEELFLSRNNNAVIRYKTTNLSSEKTAEQGRVTVIQDISDLKKLEQMRTQFVANVSHELKTPLTSIKGFAETLRDVEDPVVREKFLGIIDAESDRLKRLIDDILSLSSIESMESLKGSVVDAAEITIDSLQILEVQARDKNIDLSLIIRGQPEFTGDDDMFRQLVINLADNAIKYTEANGKVKVRLEEQDEFIVLTVQDTGIGISQEDLPRLFERFYRVDKSRNRAMGGTGLGLAIVKHITKAFGGTIQVDSKVGKGTSFTITLPAHRTQRDAGTGIRSYKFNE